MATTRFLQFSDLVAYLGENNVPNRADANLQVVELPVTTPPLHGILYLRWDKKLPYLQIIHPFAGGVPEDRVREIETAICRANTIIALPGLGYEYEKKFVYMRLCVPVFEDGLNASSFQRQLAGVIQNAKDFVGAFKDVIGGKDGADIMALAVKHKVEHDMTANEMPKA